MKDAKKVTAEKKKILDEVTGIEIDDSSVTAAKKVKVVPVPEAFNADYPELKK